jgi:hypothetical protein
MYMHSSPNAFSHQRPAKVGLIPGKALEHLLVGEIRPFCKHHVAIK